MPHQSRLPARVGHLLAPALMSLHGTVPRIRPCACSPLAGPPAAQSKAPLPAAGSPPSADPSNALVPGRRQTVLSPPSEHVLWWHNSYFDKLQRWSCQMEYGLPKEMGGLLRTLQRQQNSFRLELEVTVRSQIEVVPTTIYTSTAPLTKSPKAQGI